MKPIRTYEVAVDGWGEAKYSARSPGKARARGYRDWIGASGSSKTFGDFLCISRVRRISDPPGCGERVIVNGETVTRIYDPTGSSNRIVFMRDDSDAPSCAHSSEFGRTTAVAALQGGVG